VQVALGLSVQEASLASTVCMQTAIDGERR
jgi:hypothetical protein